MQAKRSFGRYIHSESGCSKSISLEMAGPRGLNLGGLVEGMRENILNEEFFGFINIHQDQVGGPQVPLLGHGSDMKSPNWACRDSRT